MSSLRILEAAFQSVMSKPENWDKRPDLRCGIGDVFTGLNDWEESTTWAWVEYGVYGGGGKKRCWIHFEDAPKEKEADKEKVITSWLRALEAEHAKADRSYDLTYADSAQRAYEKVANEVASGGLDRMTWIPDLNKKPFATASSPNIQKLGVRRALPPK